jgi:hypothetical protein
MLVNYFSSIYSPVFTETLSIEDILSSIRDGKWSSQVYKARTLGKGSFGYDKVKLGLPCVTFNFRFKGSKNNANIDCPTGLIYIDADGLDYFNPNEWVYASWRSVSGKGYSILVKVDGLNQSNYSDAYNKASSLIGVVADSNARKATQSTFLSWDPSLYINTDSNTLSLEKVVDPGYTNTGNIKEIQISREYYFSEKSTQLNINSRTIRWSNHQELFDRHCKSITDLWTIVPSKTDDYVETFTLRKPIADGRKTSLKVFLNNILWLNSFLLLPEELERLTGVANNYCNKSFSNPLTETEINKIITDALKSKPKFIPAKRQLRVLLNKEQIKLAGINMKSVLNRAVGQLTVERGNSELVDIMENWDWEILGKITNEKLSEQSGFAKVTIDKKLKQFPHLDNLKKSINQKIKFSHMDK